LGLQAISTRVIGLAPKIIDKRTFETVLCRGGSVERPFGAERLRIASTAINIDRLRNGGIPLLNCYREDSITHSLGKLVDVRVENGAVIGRILFHQTERGVEAAELINESGKFDISVAYAAEEIEIYDKNNALVDPNDGERANEPGLTFEIAQWQICALGLLRSDPSAVGEIADRAYRSPVAPAVAAAFERMAATHMAALGNPDQRLASRFVKPTLNVSIFNDNGDGHHRSVVSATRARMRAAQTLLESEYIDSDWRHVIMPPDMLFFGRPERL